MDVKIPRIRPVGVSVIAVLEVLLGISDIIGSLFVLFAFSFANVKIVTDLGTAFEGALLPEIFGIVLIAAGIASFVLAYGMWTGRGWAWLASVMFAVLSAALYAFGLVFGTVLDLIPVVFYLALLAYLFTGGVRNFFRHTPSVTSRQVNMVASRGLPQASSSYCTNCGRQLEPMARFCDVCGIRLR